MIFGQNGPNFCKNHVHIKVYPRGHIAKIHLHFNTFLVAPLDWIKIFKLPKYTHKYNCHPKKFLVHGISITLSTTKTLTTTFSLHKTLTTTLSLHKTLTTTLSLHKTITTTLNST